MLKYHRSSNHKTQLALLEAEEDRKEVGITNRGLEHKSYRAEAQAFEELIPIW
jgi:hypothetical protein